MGRAGEVDAVGDAWDGAGVGAPGDGSDRAAFSGSEGAEDGADAGAGVGLEVSSDSAAFSGSEGAVGAGGAGGSRLPASSARFSAEAELVVSFSLFSLAARSASILSSRLSSHACASGSWRAGLMWDVRVM